MTLLLNRSRITELLDPDTVMTGLRAGFLAAGPDVRPLRIRTDLPGPGTATALLPGVIDGIPAYTVKVNAKFPDATPALRGLVCLHDLADGELLAVLDSATVTAWRTGLAAALATHALAADHAGYEEKEKIKTALSKTMTNRCEGQFVWLQMQEQCLEADMNARHLQRVLESTPAELGYVYKRTWERILRNQRSQRALALLRWTAFALRPLSVLEITEAVLVIEDDAQGVGSTYKGRSLGSLGDLAAVSFHETKNVICGEGGALLVNNEQYLERAEILREKGTNRSQFFRGHVDKYTWVDLGSSFLPSDLVAAFLMAQQ